MTDEELRMWCWDKFAHLPGDNCKVAAGKLFDWVRFGDAIEPKESSKPWAAWNCDQSAAIRAHVDMLLTHFLPKDADKFHRMQTAAAFVGLAEAIAGKEFR